jgi:hypothetical protein
MIFWDAVIAYIIAAGIYYTVRGVGGAVLRLLSRGKDFETYGQFRTAGGAGCRRALFKRK